MTPEEPQNLVVVGETNPYGMGARYALYDKPDNASGAKLRRIFGLRRTTYFRLHKVNLCTGKWSLRRARERAAELLAEYPDADFILLGRKVTIAFGLEGVRPFSLFSTPIRAYVALPHPSGLCRTWNEPDAVQRARKLLRALRCTVPWGELEEQDEQPAPGT